MHDQIKDWEKEVDELLSDTAVHEEPAMLESHTEDAPWELEREVGHRLLAGEIDAVEAYTLLG